MEMHHRYDVHFQLPPDRGLLALGLWLRATFAGAAVAAAGFASLLDAAHRLPLLTAITWIASGGTFAWLSWQRTQARLERLDEDTPAAIERGRPPGHRPIAHAPVSP